MQEWDSCWVSELVRIIDPELDSRGELKFVNSLDKVGQDVFAVYHYFDLTVYDMEDFCQVSYMEQSGEGYCLTLGLK